MDPISHRMHDLQACDRLRRTRDFWRKERVLANERRRHGSPLQAGTAPGPASQLGTAELDKQARAISQLSLHGGALFAEMVYLGEGETPEPPARFAAMTAELRLTAARIAELLQRAEGPSGERRRGPILVIDP